MSNLFSIFFYAVFFLVFGVIAVSFIRSIQQWNQNNHSPRLTVEATVVTKRMAVSHYQHANAGDISGAHGFHTSSSTTYFATFQVASGDRLELQVNGSEYGMLVEGDHGDLTFQGTRYLDFQRR